MPASGAAPPTPAAGRPRRYRRQNRGRASTACAAAVVALLALSVTASSARAALAHSATFARPGAGAGQLSSPAGIAINQATGDIYVADSANARVDEFDSNGNFIRAWGWGVADGSSQSETCTASCQPGLGGSGQGQFTSPSSIAVDNSSGPSEGDVYVADPATNVVQKFTATGSYLATINGANATQGQFQGLVAIAVDQSGNVWTADTTTNNIDEFDPTGAFLAEWNDTYFATDAIAVDSANNAVYLIRDLYSDTGSTERWTLDGQRPPATLYPRNGAALALDPATGNLYIAERSRTNQVLEYDPANNQIADFDTPQIQTPAGAAFDSATGQLYLADSTASQILVYSPETPGPPVIDSASASNLSSTTANLAATVIPFGNGTTCVFQYVTDSQYASDGYSSAASVPCTPADLGDSYTDQTATATVGGLAPSTTYHFRLAATNSAATAYGNDQTFTTPPPPSIDAQAPANVTDTTATLTAQINPNGGATSYQFQYGTDTSYSTATVPAIPVPIGSGTADQPATVDLTGLRPATTYHFRAVADGNTFGPDRTFTTYPANTQSGLPDGRAYELVTPAQKDSDEPYVGPAGTGSPLTGSPQAASDGDALAYFSYDAFPGSRSAGSFYLSQRGPSGWTSQNLIPPQATETAYGCASIGAAIVAYSADMTRRVLVENGSDCAVDSPPLVHGEPTGTKNVLLYDSTASTYQLINLTPAGVTPADAIYEAGDQDLSHIVFTEDAPLTPGAPSGGNLYEWSAGTVSLLTTLPDGTHTQGTLAGGQSASTQNAVSADGSRIFFGAGGNLYVRVNGSSTVQVDASQAGAPGGGGQFIDATADGRLVFFTDDASAALTADTVPSSGTNLYRYDTQTGQLTDLTPYSQPQVDGVAGISTDGLAIYFVASAALTGAAQASSPNLYLLDGDQLTYIATLDPSDSCDWTASCMAARVSSDGRFIAFTSISPLTGYDNTDQSSGTPDSEIFLYSAATGELDCASCNPSGAPATGGASINGPLTPQFGAGDDSYLQRNLSDRGQVFFDTSDALLPVDTDGEQDVYEYENGQLYLISTGTSSDASTFIDASASGTDVFFATRQQLAPADSDQSVDIYDARIGGGFPPAPEQQQPCQGDACKPPPATAPAVPIPASTTYKPAGHHKRPRSKLSVRIAHATAAGVTLAITVPAAGRIRVSTAGVRALWRRLAHPGTYLATLHAKPSPARHRPRRLKVTVRYLPRAGASPATVKLTVTV